MSVDHKCQDNVPYCPGDRVSAVTDDNDSDDNSAMLYN